ncbi:MAG: ABC transporter substrate-binding protein [Clostridia bacterium]|nr:ABC transporter substrate-binding protein [Clostridia bacterium]
MKKILALIMAVMMLSALCLSLASCGDNAGTADDTGADNGADNGANTEVYNVGICQLMEHDSLDQATQGFIDALTEALEAEGKTVEFDTQVAGSSDLCPTVVNTFVAKKVDLIMANATPALLAAANATTDIPVLGTSVTDYNDTFSGSIPANVSGTSDAVPFDEQAKMMIESLNLVEGDKVGVLYCTNESNSVIQYEAVKALFEAEKIEVEAYTFSETTELQAVVTKAANDCKAIYVPSDNTVANNDTVVGSICNDAKVPVYTSYGGAICYASLAIDYYELGRETGRMAAEVLLGTKAVSDIEVATLTPTVAYNADLCAALGIEVPEAE